MSCDKALVTQKRVSLIGLSLDNFKIIGESYSLIVFYAVDL